jgi:AraC-like DNA-binding protein
MSSIVCLPMPSAPPESCLDRARLIIESEYASPLTAQRLARRLRLPRLAFHQGFLAAFGASPQHYLRRCRMQAAARLLSEGSDRHTVAQRVGYSAFTPFAADYRREFRGDQDRARVLDEARRAQMQRA